MKGCEGYITQEMTKGSCINETQDQNIYKPKGMAKMVCVYVCVYGDLTHVH